jgi:hypothetical protein
MADRHGVQAAAKAAASLPPAERQAYVHTLSLRLTADQYRRLRRFVTGYEDHTGQRLTHQAVLETALGDYLGRQDVTTLG